MEKRHEAVIEVGLCEKQIVWKRLLSQEERKTRRPVIAIVGATKSNRQKARADLASGEPVDGCLLFQRK